jgi:hypothetical protein
MASVFQNIDPPSPSPPGECVPRTKGGRRRKHSLGGEVGGGSIFWKTSDKALYSTYVSTVLCEAASSLVEVQRRTQRSVPADYPGAIGLSDVDSGNKSNFQALTQNVFKKICKCVCREDACESTHIVKKDLLRILVVQFFSLFHYDTHAREP